VKKRQRLFIGILAISSIVACVSLTPGLLWRSSNTELHLSASEQQILSAEALAGNAKSAVRLANFYLVVEQDIHESLRWRKVAADNGDPEAAKWVESYNRNNLREATN
jgi:TPR repeat protein